MNRMLTATLKNYSIYIVFLIIYLIYKLHDFTEPFAYGHARWSDAYFYWFGMMHLDLGFLKTQFMNVEGMTGAGELIYYRSAGSMEGVMHAFMLYLFNAEPWAVRVIPLFFTIAHLVVLTIIGRKLVGPKCALFVALLYLLCPFIIKYGSCDTFGSISVFFGLSGWLGYLIFLEKNKRKYLIWALLLFSVGIPFSWKSGFMALPIFFHIFFWEKEILIKVKWLSLFSTLIIAPFFLILLHQGIVTEDYFYPVRRVLERSKSVDDVGLSLSWGRLFFHQIERGWQYFGQITCLLFLYWLVKLIFINKFRTSENLWILAFFLSGIFYGFVFKNAAYIHDYLMMGFLPGLILAATSGALEIKKDVKKYLDFTSANLISTFVVFSFFIIHIAIGYRSAVYFEEQKRKDLENGEATVAFFLKENLKDSDLLIADYSSGYHPVDSADGKTYGNLKPHLSYLTRRPVRFVKTNNDLKQLTDEIQKNDLRGYYVRLDNEHSNSVIVDNYYKVVHDFNGGKVFLLNK